MTVNVFGEEFRFTSRAVYKINELMESLEGTEYYNYVPVLTWISTISDRTEFIPGPHLGLNKNEEIVGLKLSFYEVGNYKVFINLDKKRTDECKVKVLDYVCKRFFLIYDDDLHIMAGLI